VAKVDSTHVQAMIDDLVDDGFSASTIRKAKAALQSALADARRRGLVGWNACVGARLPTQQKTEMKYWRPDQTKQFLRAIEGQPNEAYYVIALTLGPRIGEILGLRWQDIDLDKGTLRIERQLLQKRVAGAFQFGDVKRYSARRTVNLGKLATAALRAHRSRMAEKRLPVAEDLVFCTSQGRPFYQSHIQRQFKRLTKMAGQPQIRVHDMRHTAAALMILSRLPDIVISKTLGHSSVTITKDIYGHLFEEQKQQVADAMDRLLGGSV
jgi:integrase